MGKKPFKRLPENVVPVNYDIVITPNFQDFSFDGSQSIQITIDDEAATSEVVLNAMEMTVRNVTWQNNKSPGTLQNAGEINFNMDMETLTFKFDPPLPAGASGVLKMEFTGTLNDKMNGFYRTKFKMPNGVEKYNAVTQFEATSARRCFPCWDEPAIKATFDITLVVEKDKVALSNMPVKEISPVPNNDTLHKVHFGRTPIMSTYLVALVVGDYEFIETKSSDGILCRVYTSPGKKEQGQFALDVAARALTFYKEYFGIPCELPKVDLIAIPDFGGGAMENWGLVAYRESSLLIDEKQSASSTRQSVALTVCHEIGHFWFGNLVTPNWWQDLWLKEGFASFLEYFCVDHLIPEFDIWSQFITRAYGTALELDCLENSHPIEVPVGHPSEVDEIFDDISYDKGASIIRMLHQYAGSEGFQKGMNLYLTRHQYKNAATIDLWAALGEASEKPVAAVMQTWTKQMGFPLIRVLSSRQEGQDRIIELAQEKFTLDDSKNGNYDQYKWMVPLTFSSASKPNQVIHSVLMKQETLTVTIPNVAADEWVKLNPGLVGFYRVQYPPSMLEQFLPAIQQKQLSPVDRLGLLDDLFALVRSGQSTTTEVLKLMVAFKNEDNYTVWCNISSIIMKLNSIIQYTNFHQEFKKYGRELYSGIVEEKGWVAKPNESHLDSMLRALVLLRMTSFDHEETLQECKKRFHLHLTGENPVPADLRMTVYRGAMSCGDEATFESMLKHYRDCEMLEEKSRIGRSLGDVKNEQLLKKTLEFAMSNDVRLSESVCIIVSVGLSKLGRDIAWQFIKDNKDLLKSRYPGGVGNYTYRLVRYVTEEFVTDEMAAEVESFFAANPFDGAERAVQQAVESIRLNAAWLKRDGKEIGEYLQSINSK